MRHLRNLLVGPKRLRMLVLIALANGLVIFSTLYYQWSLLEVVLAYMGEFLLLGAVNYARFLAARQFGPRKSGRDASAWKLRGAKTVNILMTLAMCTVFSALPFSILFLTGAVGERAEVVLDFWRPLAVCWAAFLATHVFGFIEVARRGGYRVLISDARVLVLIWRYLPLLVGAIGASDEAKGFPSAAWFFVTVLATMAVVDAVTYLVDLEEDEAAFRKLAARA